MENTVGLRIKKIRDDKRLSQDYLAACLNVTQSNYGRLEKDDNRLTIPKLVKIAGILEVKVSLLLDEKTEKLTDQNNNQNTQLYNTDSFANSHQEHIASLKDEISFLRNLLKKE